MCVDVFGDNIVATSGVLCSEHSVLFCLQALRANFADEKY